MFGVNMFVVLFFVLIFPFYVAEVCKDTVTDCHTYVKDELCTGSFQLYGAQACRKTCGHCNDSCVDEISNCSDYNTNTDICNSNYTWSLTHCKKFCGFCGFLGESCKESIFCVRIRGASCKENVCTCDAGFRPLANIECEEVFWKKCNTTHGCDGLQNAHCMVPSSPGTTLVPWTNTTRCLCKPDYVYVHENHSCDADCGNLKAPQNGSVNISEGTTFGSKANYSCDIGYTLYGSNTAECEATGNWSNHYVNCTINDCGDPGTPVNGTADKPNGTKYQAVITYKCDTGFDMVGNRTAVCQANETWSNDRPTCKIKDCRNHTAPTNGFVNTSQGSTFGSQASYSCKTGYTLNGNNISACEATGNWSNQNVNCTINDCGQPKQTSFGYASLDSGQTVYLHNATYVCESGFKTNNITHVMCNASGYWSSPPPTCIDIDECTTYTANCHKWANCTNFVGTYVCRCKMGFSDISPSGTGTGHKCEDINECAKENMCNPNGSLCVNYPGSFRCDCNDGWTGNYCDEDINECAGRSECNRNGSLCVNYPGGYRCNCNDGWTGTYCKTALQGSRMCFGCEDMSSPLYCDSVLHCKSNEVCFLESHLLGHGTIFRSGCMDENTCHFMQFANTNSVCVECCNNDFCNKRGCGNTDFPAREHRGPVCFDCHHTGDPNTCDTVTMCTSNQVCSIEKFQWGDNFHYKQGCSHPVCNSLSRRRRSIPICHSCCNDDFCNRNCSSNAIDNSGVFVG